MAESGSTSMVAKDAVADLPSAPERRCRQSGRSRVQQLCSYLWAPAFATQFPKCLPSPWPHALIPNSRCMRTDIELQECQYQSTDHDCYRRSFGHGLDALWRTTACRRRWRQALDPEKHPLGSSSSLNRSTVMGPGMAYLPRQASLAQSPRSS